MSEKKLRILVVTNNYPSQQHPHVGTFVAALVEEWVRIGSSVTVLAPRALRSTQALRQWWSPTLPSPSQPLVAQPPFLSFSARRLTPFGGSTRSWTQTSFERAALRATRKMKQEFDVIYGHFLYPGGAAAARIGRELGLPAVVALGESSMEHWIREFGWARARRDLDNLNAIVSVSLENADWIKEKFDIPSEKITVVPNAVDTNRFTPMDRSDARKQLGLPSDRLIGVFVGHFIDRKGPLRALDAINRNPNVSGVFLGSGPQVPTGDAVLHAGHVPHAEIPIWLSAGDFFIFPTLAEGSPNAAIEAMACGLPVVSSNIPSLRETVSEAEGRLVDPESADALASAVRELAESPDLRAQLAKGALERARRFTLPKRARLIHGTLEALTRDTPTST